MPIAAANGIQVSYADSGRLGEISCPALIVHGSQDAAIQVARAEQMRDGLAGPTTVTLIEGLRTRPTSPTPVRSTPRSPTSCTAWPAS